MDRALLTADPKACYVAHEAEIRAAVERVLASGRYVLGPEVEGFEREFSAYQESGVTIGVANGTEAIELALRAVGVKRGDAVATVANTVSATVSAIEQIGARPVFVEIDGETMTMSADALGPVLERHAGTVKAVLPVHLYGQPADMVRIGALAERFGAAVVEDCAQAHGARWQGRRVGTWGHAAAFSFYPTKNLGALGDGGAVFSRDAAVGERVRLLRQYGWRERYVSELPGRNSRLDELQAAILRVKLRYLESENEHRRQLARRYLERLRDSGLRLPVVAAGSEPVWHQFVVRSRERDGLREHLAREQIMTGVLYPVPVHRQPAYNEDGLHLPETEQACAEVLSLPLHPALSAGDVDTVCAQILRWPRP
ncbi:MAG TPA: DegT/DnrJ/EryC1/StrS family aminotransferase [Opitutus sp.]|nr:DegT/DnrJ/EryC1/StrS family aminotransferase [Opitutus sp.]